MVPSYDARYVEIKLNGVKLSAPAYRRGVGVWEVQMGCGTFRDQASTLYCDLTRQKACSLAKVLRSLGIDALASRDMDDPPFYLLESRLGWNAWSDAVVHRAVLDVVLAPDPLTGRFALSRRGWRRAMKKLPYLLTGWRRDVLDTAARMDMSCEMFAQLVRDLQSPEFTPCSVA